MLLTRAGEYALLTLVAISKSDKPISVSILSRKLDISESFLAKILQSLARNGIVKSIRGASGGFELSKLASEITLLDILQSVEKDTARVFKCTSDDECTRRNDACNLFPFLMRLQKKIDNFLLDITLEDLAKE
jgi:Rrf2 family iron-sulfur cluster assembly transcriptional regulator